MLAIVVANMPLFFCGTVPQSRPRKLLNLQGLSTDIPSAAVVQIVHPRHSMPETGRADRGHRKLVRRGRVNGSLDVHAEALDSADAVGSASEFDEPATLTRESDLSA
jgi:hypothetical protein